MPTPVIVIAAIAVFIAFLLITRVKVCVGYTGNFEFSLKYLFVAIRIKKRKEGQAKHVKKPPAKFSYEQLRTFLDLFKRFYDDMKASLEKVRKKARIDNIGIDLTIGGDDAAETAIAYGEACAIIYPALSSLEMLVKIKKRKISIDAGFNKEACLAFDFCVSMRLCSIITVGVATAFKIFVSLIKNPINARQRGVVK
jgi:hypothetical protein